MPGRRPAGSAQEVAPDRQGQLLGQAFPGQGPGRLQVLAVHHAMRAHRVDEPEGEVQGGLRVRMADMGHYRGEEAAERLIKRVVSACLQELLEQGIGASEDDGVAGAHGCTAEALRKHGFADTDGSNENGMLLTREELQGEQRLELAAVDLNGRTPIELLERELVFEAGLIQTPLEAELSAPLDLVRE